MKIKIIVESDSGVVLGKREAETFESAEEDLGMMERYITKHYLEEEPIE